MPKRSPRLIINSIKKYGKYLLMVFGIFLGIAGVLCIVFSKKFVNRFIDNHMELRPDNKIVDKWIRPDVNLTLQLYFFNWTNSEEFFNHDVKPKLQEIGPYSFVEIPQKEIFQWHPENNTLDYGKKHWYYFDKAKSKRPLDDELITLNALLVSAASKTKDWSFMQRSVVDVALRLYKNGIVWKRTAEEFFFKGFEDNLVNLLSVFPSSFRSSMGIFVPWDRIGFIYGRNGSSDLLGRHTISTGVGNMEQYGQLLLWNGKNYTEHLPEECSAVKGSPGEFQKTNLEKNKSIQYFVIDFCRTVNLDYLDEVEVDGILGYRYIISPNLYDNGTLNTANECFCNGECLPYGAVNISGCWFGLPLFISNPHFLDADTYFISKVDGLKPDVKMHTTTVILEPRTGLMLELKGKLQMNFYIEPSSHIRSYQTKRRMLFPVFWLDIYMRTSKSSIQMLQIINKLEKYLRIVGALIITLSLLIFIWRPLKLISFKDNAHHMEINSMINDDNDYVNEDISDKTKENNFTSLLNISHPRRSLPTIISQLAKDDEYIQRQQKRVTVH